MQIASSLPDRHKGQLPLFSGRSLVRPNFQTRSGGKQIGSLRLPTTNPLKTNNEESIHSIIGATCFAEMSVAQLRIEDYFLIRTGELTNSQNSLIKQCINIQCFNKELLQQDRSEQRNNPIDLSEGDPNEISQTINKRLQMCNIQRPSSRNSNFGSQQLANVAPIQPPTFKIAESSPFRNQSQFPLGKDQQFKEHYQKQRQKLIHNQNVRQMLEYYLEREVKQRVGEIKSFNCNEALIKEYRQIIEMRAILEEFRADQYRRMKADRLTAQQQAEAEKMWTAFSDIYSQRLTTIYNNYHGRLTADILKQFVAQIKNNQLRRLFAATDHKITPNTQSSHLSQYDDTKLSNTGEQLSSLWNTAKQIHISRQMETINTLKLKLKTLYERERVERQLHLYDVVNPYEQTGNIDDYLRPRKKSSITVQIINKKGTSKRYNNRPHLSVRTVEVGSQVQEFLPVQSRRQDKSRSLVVNYLFRIVWIGSLSRVYKELKGGLQLPRQCMPQQIYVSLEKKLRKEEQLLVKSDARFQFFELTSTSQMGVYNLEGNVWQQVINLPSNYSYSFKELRHLVAEGLIIQNDFGKMEWQQKVDLEGIDFSAGEVKIEDNCVVCEPEGLNRKCRVTFKSLPASILKAKNSEGPQAAEKVLKKYLSKVGGCRLENIQWGQNARYSLLFSRFGEKARN